MMLQIAPRKRGAYVAPEEALLRLLRCFDQVTASRTAADAENARLLAKFEALAKLTPPPDLETIRATHGPGTSLLVRLSDGHDPVRFVQALLRPSTPVELLFSKALNAAEQRAMARKLADALDYGVYNLPD
ncbi:hypothetical protein EG835_14840 [bacterium]|nr:hypothetical protein [bacterium]